ncbi:MAG: ASKHA domain-containing protein [Candidatus Omnitrophota bacterium]
MAEFNVTFLPDNIKINVPVGKTILDAAISAGVYIHSSCGGEGVCGRCKVIIKEGKASSAPSGRVSKEEREKGYCLACLSVIESNIVVEIPPESRLEFDKISEEEAFAQRLKGMFSKAEDIDRAVSFVKSDIFSHSPLATKLFLKLEPATLEDKTSDLERVYREIRKKEDLKIMQTGLANIRRLGEILRSSNWDITVTLGRRGGTNEVVLVQPGDTSNKNYGFAFDIGTTTVSGQLIDLNARTILGTKASHNKQASFGTDIISRIVFAKNIEGLERLHHAVIDVMNDMIRDLINANSIDLNDVTCCLCAGNPTMMHLLLKIDPTYIRREPYVPTANFIPVIRASEAGIKINPRGLLATVPSVASYVGGDTVAGIVSCGIDKSRVLTLLIDVGTNGEIVLGNKDWLVACAASAGPAFEGSGVSCGMRATKGAIQRVSIDKNTLEAKYETILDAAPVGICGSGYIDLLAEMLYAGIIDGSGKINPKRDSSKIINTDTAKAFVVVKGENSGSGNDIVITDEDIDNLKRSKAAIFAAAATLVRHMGIKLNDIKKIFIAGGFGTYLDIQKAIAIGLLPDLDKQRFLFVGNSSLAGAREILLSSQAMNQAEEIAKKITYFELSTESSYMDEYTAALFFPHTDRSKFPSVKL